MRKYEYVMWWLIWFSSLIMVWVVKGHSDKIFFAIGMLIAFGVVTILNWIRDMKEK